VRCEEIHYGMNAFLSKCPDIGMHKYQIMQGLMPSMLAEVSFCEADARP
jgi:hypothetical protein